MANVNVINKNNTDYYFEDTAGRNLTATKQDDSLVAVKAYAVGDFFWYNDKLYRVKSAVASGATIVLATDADETTVGAQLSLKVNDSPTFSQASTRANLEGSGETFSTILGKIKKYFADLKDLAYVGVADTDPNDKYLRGDGTWQMMPKTAPIAPDPAASVTENDIVDAVEAALLEGGVNDEVVSIYGTGLWSNTDSIQLVAEIDKDDDGLGTWVDSDWESGTRSGWLWDESLYQVIEDGNGNRRYDIKLEPIFDIADSETVSLYAWRVDDAVYVEISNPSGDPQAQGWFELSGSTYVATTDTTVVSGKTYYKGGGAIAFKLNGKIQSTHAYIGVEITKLRTKYKVVTPLT